MPYRICKTIDIENGHMLSKHPDLCRFPHGHSRKVEMVLEADSLDRNEMVCDFKVIKMIIDDFLKSWDHAICMNTQDSKYQMMKSAFHERVIGFQNEDATTEVMARCIFEVLKTRLSEYAGNPGMQYPIGTNVRVLKIRLWETATAWAEYSET